MLYVHEEFPEHVKWEAIQEADPRLYVELIGVWTLAGCDCRKRLTDGAISLARLERVTGLGKRARDLGDRLVAAGFWEQAVDGYQFHDWADVQDTKATVQARRNKWKAAKRSGKESTKASAAESVTDSTSESSPESRADSRTNRRGEAREGSDSGSQSATVVPFAERRATEPWLRVWQLFEQIKGRSMGSATSNRNACEAIATACLDRLSDAEPFDAVAERGLRVWLADAWVARERPPLSNLATNPGKYLDAPPEPPTASSGAPYHDRWVP